MSDLDGINFPPDEILNPKLGKTPNYEYIILWMLSNNKICEWSDFTEIISESTLSGHLKKLLNKEHVEKIKKGHYSITSDGIQRFNELNYIKKTGKRKIIYPPQAILRKRNYDHWILWMVYNNSYCKWSDFRDEPLAINQSSLSKNKEFLINNEYIVNENKQYKITAKGKSEYFNMLKQYDLDRQAILDEESKRIEDITKHVITFFKNHDIKSEDIKFRFLNHVLKLDHDRIKSTLASKGDFYKILLYLSINHPNQYPKFISFRDFSVKYEIEETTLRYYIMEIVEKEIYPIKFFKLETEDEKVYYFQVNEKLEKILSALVEDYITKYTYLDKLYTDLTKYDPSFSIVLMMDYILDEVCGSLLSEELKNPLRKFLPDYIKYLAYKVETEKRLNGPVEKLEGIAWQSIPEMFRSYDFSEAQQVYYQSEGSWSIDSEIFEVLDIYFLCKLDFLKTEKFKEQFSGKNKEIIRKIQNMLEAGKVNKARNLIENPDVELNEFEKWVIGDIVSTISREFEDSLSITSNLIKKYPNSFVGYLLQSWTYFILSEEDKSLELIEQGLKISSNILLTYQKIQTLIKMNRVDDAKKLIDAGLKKNPNDIYLQKSEVLFHIYGDCGCSDNQKLKDINISGISEVEFIILRCILLCRSKRYKEAKKLLKSPEMSTNIFDENPRVDIAAYFILIFCNLARGKYEKALELSNKVISNYPEHPNSLLTRALVYGYNILYNFNPKDINVEIFIETVDNLINLDPIKSNKSRYYQFKSYILTKLKLYEESIEALDAAITFDPKRIDLYYSKNKIYIQNEEGDNALELMEVLLEKFPQRRKKILKIKSSTYSKIGMPEEGLNLLEELLKEYPDDINIINNLAIMLANAKRKEEAIAMAEKQIELYPKEGNAYDTYGEILMDFGKYDEAIEQFEIALEVDPSGWFAFHAHTKMGNCYRELKKYELAKKHFIIGCQLEEKLLPNENHIDAHDPHRYLAEIEKLIEEENKKLS